MKPDIQDVVYKWKGLRLIRQRKAKALVVKEWDEQL